ncbi:unnamed protein product, partial [Brenthis ino]
MSTCMNKTQDDDNSYKALRRRVEVPCEFCDRIFKNRFDSVVHNSSHIIIPLIKQSLFICDICNSFFKSQDDLNVHHLNKHPDIFIKHEEISYDAYPKIKEPTELSDSKEINNVITEPIKNRLKFEDDDVTFKGILKDLVTECKVNVQICDQWDNVTKCYEASDAKFSEGFVKPIVHVKIEEEKSLVDKLVLDEPLTDEYLYDNFVGNANNQKFESIHYSLLVKPGIFNCRYCYTSFPDRFSLIQHEVVHMKIGKYIAGNHYNLNKHIQKHHCNIKKIAIETKKCEKCRLKYRKCHRHTRDYNSEVVTPSVKLLKVCDLCISFFRCTIRKKYYVKGTTKDELGVRYPCEVCGILHFKLKIVERITNYQYGFKSKKKKTNEDRLKLIQHRLKKLNLLNKY